MKMQQKYGVLQYVILKISSPKFHIEVAEMYVSVLLSSECHRLPNNDFTLQYPQCTNHHHEILAAANDNLL